MELDSLDHPLYHRVPDVLRLQAVPMASDWEPSSVPFQHTEEILDGGVEGVEL